MSYFEKTSILTADAPSVDPFFRFRVTTPYTVFDNKQLYDTGSLYWSNLIVGNGTASYYPNNSSVILSTSGSSSGAGVFRQSKRHFNYQPGKGQTILMTNNFSGSVSNVIKRAGYFDQNNGLYFVSSGSSFGCGIRADMSGTPTDTFITQSLWNLDTLNGVGPSGQNINITASQIWVMDFQWLGVGRIRYGVVLNGQPVYAHQITNENALSSVYMSYPNLPIRYELINSGSGTQASMLHICTSVQSDGGFENNGTIRAADNSTNGITVDAGSYSGLLAIRLFSGSLNGSMVPISVSGMATTATNCLFTLLLNPSSSAWNWLNIPNSIMQYATASSTGNTIVSEGTKYNSIYIAGTFSSLPTMQLPIDPLISMGSDQLGNADVLVLAVNNITTTSAFYGSMIWRESV